MTVEELIEILGTLPSTAIVWVGTGGGDMAIEDVTYDHGAVTVLLESDGDDDEFDMGEIGE